MAVVIDDVDRSGVYARSSQGRRVQPAATNRHSHISTRRWCVGGLAVKQDACDRSRDFPAQSEGSSLGPPPSAWFRGLRGGILASGAQRNPDASNLKVESWR